MPPLSQQIRNVAVEVQRSNVIHRDAALEILAKAAAIVAAYERSGLDICACVRCGAVVVSVCDGLSVCEPCHDQETETDAQ